MKTGERVFISYNSADSEYCRHLASALKATGANVWLDVWKIRPGDSIPAAIDEGLSGFDIFALVWSQGASLSNWVKTEMFTALTRWINMDSCRIVPILLDDTPIPTLLKSIRYIDGRNRDHIQVTRELLGIDSDRKFRLAVQEFLEEAGLEFQFFPGVGYLVACPNCGATLDNLRGCSYLDKKRDDLYEGYYCEECGWSDGGEV